MAVERSGTITIEEALSRYQLTEEEFLSWQRAFETHGLAGLRACSAIPQVEASAPPQIATLISIGFARPRNVSEEKQAGVASEISSIGALGELDGVGR